MKTIPLLLALAALCGCNSVGYSRTDTTGATERFTARGLFMNVNAQNLSVGGRNGTNIHGLTVKGVAGAGDVESMRALVETAISTAVKSAKP